MPLCAVMGLHTWDRAFSILAAGIACLRDMVCGWARPTGLFEHHDAQIRPLMAGG